MSYPTWSDLNSPSIVPPLGARQAQELGSCAVMVSTAQDMKFMASTFGSLTEAPFFNSRLLRDAKTGITFAGPYIGAPYGVMLLESLVARGVRNILVMGWCGALTQDLDIGDLVVPSMALCDEGTSKHYAALVEEPPVIRPDALLSRQLSDSLGSRGESVHDGAIWTSDAIYRETREKVDWFKKRGAMAVEMECSALFAAAAFRQVKIAALLVVSDSLARKTWNPGFKNKRFKPMRQTACKTIMDLVRTLANDF